MSLKYKQQGFTLLEVLITIIILSVGMLGVANLQMLGLNYNNNAYHRSQAVQLAYDIIDRMRLNPTAVRAGNYSGGTSVGNYQDMYFYQTENGSIGKVAYPSIGTKPACDKNNPCNATNLARYDLHHWQDALDKALPKVLNNNSIILTKSRITVRGDNRYSIHIYWGEKVEDTTGNGTFATNFEAKEFVTYVQLNQ